MEEADDPPYLFDIPPEERVCLPPGETREPVDLLTVPPAPEGVETEPCVKCNYPLWEQWRDCPKCAWPRD